VVRGRDGEACNRDRDAGSPVAGRHSNHCCSNIRSRSQEFTASYDLSWSTGFAAGDDTAPAAYDTAADAYDTTA